MSLLWHPGCSELPEQAENGCSLIPALLPQNLQASLTPGKLSQATVGTQESGFTGK